MRAVLGWLTDAALAESIVGDLEEGRRREGALWFARAAAGVVGYIAWRRLAELATAGGAFRGGLGDARQAIRALRRRPTFALCAILLLALGIGANTAVFSVVRAVLLRPLPYTQPERLAFVWGEPTTRQGNRHAILTGRNVAGIATAASIESFAVIESWEGNLGVRVDIVAGDVAERLRGVSVTPNFFELLGVRAALGRTFSSGDRDVSQVVISDALWRRRFDADPKIVGRVVPLAAGRSKRAWANYTIAGVLPAEFRYTYPRETEIYLPKPWHDIRPNGAVIYDLVARLKPGVTAAQTEAELLPIAARIIRGYGWSAKDTEEILKRSRMFVEPVQNHLQAEVRPGLLLLTAAAGLVLLIACVNLGLLLLARTVDRRGELGLRAALGAGRARIIGELLGEGVLLSLAGGALGLAMAAVTQPAIRFLLPPIVPRVDQIGIDAGVLAFTAVLMILTTLVCVIAPAMFVIRRDLVQAVRGTSASSTAGRGLLLSRRVIVAVQAALVVVMLVGSALLLRSFWRLQHVDLGFQAEDVVTMEMRLLNSKYREPGRLDAFHAALLDRVRAVPGVANAGLTTAVPMRGTDFTRVAGPKGKPGKAGNMRVVDPSFFGVMHVPLKAGRYFNDGDTAASEPVVIVSESYGRLHFGTGSPIGGFLDLDKPARIVGVVGDLHYAAVNRDAAPAFYLPHTQQPIELICLVVEPRPGTRAAVVDGVRAAVHILDPEQPVEGMTTIDQIVQESTADRRFYAVTTGAFTVVALCLAVSGVFGVVSRTVSERRRELAIRLALGAEPRRLRRLVFGYGLLPVGLGAIVGVAAALTMSRWLESLLFQVAATDVASYAAAAAVVLAVAALACYSPARRTLRVPPMSVLKSD